MKKLKLRQGIASILLAGTILVTGSSLTGCSDSEYPNNNSTFIDKEYNDEDTGKTKIFQPGEHIISKNTTEKINLIYYTDSGCALSAASDVELCDACIELLNNPEKLQRMTSMMS